MIDLQSAVATARAVLALAILASSLAGCVQADGFGSSVPSDTARAGSPWAGERSADPYHYRCTGACLRSF